MISRISLHDRADSAPVCQRRRFSSGHAGSAQGEKGRERAPAVVSKDHRRSGHSRPGPRFTTSVRRTAKFPARSPSSSCQFAPGHISLSPHRVSRSVHAAVQRKDGILVELQKFADQRPGLPTIIEISIGTRG